MMEFSHSKCAWLNVLIITNLIKVEEMIIIKFSSLKPAPLRLQPDRRGGPGRGRRARAAPCRGTGRVTRIQP
jgi:hypothetical protein